MADTLFRKEGFAKVSIADIASALEMSPANVFKHFHSKTALADAIADRHLSKATERFASFDDDTPPPERLLAFLRRMMEAHLADIRDNPYIFEMVMMISKADLPSTHRYGELVRRSIADIIRAGVATGDYVCDDPDGVAVTVMDSTVCVMHPLLLVNVDPATLQQRCNSVVAFVNKALSPHLPSDD